jgi:ABC-type Na+ transport system ATPase subunit NatA
LRILTDDPTPVGLLDFPRYSKGLSDIIQHSDPQFTIGIFGEWGTGKTTLMKMIEEN